ncbi:uncharacterized protein Z518_08048 [Rhinocladiella mackenziei CBS 650.93]|uniref:O-methyltransferase C-terminal domain-containing protein n=1 Tax=Rhinocladiella mackenziei CBS 650.93 TaxID=1442369 RepID=A0A0D2I8C3_9EURO|nr:uncharacterized protein Z518_08048 [Rhinocladiella mackenziei CBS 650.93]KIX02109.1 hypothetical protein Z518_08048 [Rhinocladiella mackenziei CBS 650.93]
MALSDFPSPEELQTQIKKLADAANSYNAAPGPVGLGSRMRMISQAQELIRSLTDPSDMGGVHIAQAMELVAIRTLLHLKAFHSMPPAGSISLTALSQVTGAEEALLERLLRMAVCVGFIRQLENMEYAHTKFSLAYATTPGPGTFFQLVYDEGFLAIDNLHGFLQEKGFKEPVDQRYSPYTWRWGEEGKTVWEVMAQYPERFQAFQTGLAHADATVPLTGFYDFSKLNTDGDRPILVDIGGGNGHSIMRIMEAHPKLPPHKFVLQELKEPAEEARKILPKEVAVMEHDFFTPQTLIGAKAYFLRRVMHDYSDVGCIDILKNIVPAMAYDSVVLLADFCFAARTTPADLPIAAMDIGIFNMGGKERSEEGFKKILEAAGLEFVKLYRSEVGFGAIVEAKRPLPN